MTEASRNIAENSQCWGNYIELDTNDTEYLFISFSPTSMPIQQRWRNNGLSADFISSYMRSFFIADEDENSSAARYRFNAVKYVANELLENAMKFHDPKHEYPITISFHLLERSIVFYVANGIEHAKVSSFQGFIKKLLESDPNDLYFQQMEANAEASEHKQSGLGFLSMLCDYSAKLSWKFEPQIEQPDACIVTTRVALDL